MRQSAAEKVIRELLETAGIHINGVHPWDVQVHNQNLYSRVLKENSLGLGEAYMDGWWDCDRLDLLFDRILRAGLDSKIKTNLKLALKLLIHKYFNFQTKKRSLQVGKEHYDLGNDLYEFMLDSNMNYTCGYWKNASNLDEAQIDKLELTCQKLMLSPGMRVLDIGCGFGAFAKYAAKNFGVEVVGVTISQEQRDYAIQNCAGLPVEIRFQDYRDASGKFDRIVSLGMFEHVGPLNYDTYMSVARNCLKDDGIFLLHTIGTNISSISICDPWTAKYIFPNGVLPSIAQIAKSTENKFIMEDWHNFGADYEKTLLAWHNNFSKNWDKLKSNYDERFSRMWRYYLLSSAGAFRARNIQLWQIVFSKQGIVGGYQCPRLDQHPRQNIHPIYQKREVEQSMESADETV